MVKKRSVLFKLVSSVGTGFYYIGKKNSKYGNKEHAQEADGAQVRSHGQQARAISRAEAHFGKKKISCT